MHPESKFSCVRFMFRTFKLFAWFRHTYGVKKCICCLSIFSTPRLFALFAASPGFKQSLQLFYLWYPPPICVLYHPYWVRTACNCMYYFSIFEVPPPIYMASDFTLNRCCHEIAALNRSNATEKKKSSIHPLKPLKDAFERIAPNRTAKQEPRTKIQQNKCLFLDAPKVNGFICDVHFLYLHDICMV